MRGGGVDAGRCRRRAPVLDASTNRAPPLSPNFPRAADSARTVATDGWRSARRRRCPVRVARGSRSDRAERRTCDLHGFSSFLLPVVTQYLQSALEVEHAANELAERYEEINLLYTISEILGRTVALDEAAQTILIEVSETVGARRASVLVSRSRHEHAARRRRARRRSRLGAADRRRRPVQRQRARLPHAASDAGRGRPDALPAGSRAIAAAPCSPCRSCGRLPRRAAPSRWAS